MTSVRASEAPLVCTFSTSNPAAKRKRSSAMCVALPTPAVAHASLPGAAFAAATKSCSVLYLPGGVISTVGIVATVATGASSFGSRPGLISGETVKAEAYIMIVCPSGSWPATHFAPTSPPAPSRFSTITGWPSAGESFSARMRAIVSEALPGVTPDTKRTVLWGKGCAAAAHAKAAPTTNTATRFIASSWLVLNLGQSELRRQPIGAAAAVAIRAIIGVVPAVFHHQELDRPGHALRQALGMRRRNEAVLAAGDDEQRAGDLARGFAQRQRGGLALRLGLRRGVAAHAESVPGQLGKRVPDLRPLERTRQRDAGAEPLLERRGARRIVAAEAHAPHGDALRVEVAPFLDPVHDDGRGALVIAADRNLVFGLALPRAVDGERGDTAR